MFRHKYIVLLNTKYRKGTYKNVIVKLQKKDTFSHIFKVVKLKDKPRDYISRFKFSLIKARVCLIRH